MFELDANEGLGRVCLVFPPKPVIFKRNIIFFKLES